MKGLLAILAASLSLTSAWAGAPREYPVSVGAIHPTQMQVGLAEARVLLQEHFIDRAIGDEPALADFKSRPTANPRAPLPPLKSLSQLSAEQRTLLRSRLDSYFEKKPPKMVRGVVGPDGAIYVTDGHHRLAALLLLTLAGAPPLLDPEKALVRVSVAPDMHFEGHPREFAQFVARTGFFTREVRDKYARHELTAEQLVALLPRTLVDMLRLDNPTRSTIGKLFYLNGIESERFLEHLEFLVAEKVACDVAALPGYEYDADTLGRARRAVFGSFELVAFIRSRVSPGPERRRAEGELADAVASYRKDVAARERKGLAEPFPSRCVAR